jgi:hypothetical protein
VVFTLVVATVAPILVYSLGALAALALMGIIAILIA